MVVSILFGVAGTGGTAAGAARASGPAGGAGTERISVSTGGEQGDGDSYGGSSSADGRYVVFASRATDLVPGDTNAWQDVYARDTQSCR